MAVAGPPGEVLGEAHVVLVVEPVLVGRHPRDHADHPAAHPQRHEQRTAQLQLARDAQLLGVAGAGDEHLVGDLVDQLGPPGERDRPRTARAGGVRGPALVQRDRELDLARVDVGDGEPVHPAVADDVDGAPVGEGGHGQAGDPVDRDLEVEAARQLDGGLREELQPRGLPPGHRGGLDPLEGLGAGVGHDVEEVELGRVGREVARQGQVDRPDRAACRPQRQRDHGAFAAVDPGQVRVRLARWPPPPPAPGACPVRMTSVVVIDRVNGTTSHCCASRAGRPRSPMIRALSPSRRASAAIVAPTASAMW